MSRSRRLCWCVGDYVAGSAAVAAGGAVAVDAAVAVGIGVVAGAVVRSHHYSCCKGGKWENE